MSFEQDLAVIRELDRLYLLAERYNTPSYWKRYDEAVDAMWNRLPRVTNDDRRHAVAAMDRIVNKEENGMKPSWGFSERSTTDLHCLRCSAPLTAAHDDERGARPCCDACAFDPNPPVHWRWHVARKGASK